MDTVKNVLISSPVSQIELNQKLWAAAMNGNTDAIIGLIPLVEDINKQNNNGKTALILAARRGHTSCVVALVNAKADLTITSEEDNGDTALIGAARYGHIAVVGILITAGANLTAENAVQETALNVAMKGNHQNVAFLLLSMMSPTMVAQFKQENAQRNCLLRKSLPILSEYEKAVSDLPKHVLGMVKALNKAKTGHALGQVNSLLVIIADYMRPEWHTDKMSNPINVSNIVTFALNKPKKLEKAKKLLGFKSNSKESNRQKVAV